MKTTTTTLHWYNYPEEKPETEEYKFYLIKHESITFTGKVSFVFKICVWDGEEFLYRGNPLYISNFEYINLSEIV